MKNIILNYLFILLTVTLVPFLVIRILDSYPVTPWTILGMLLILPSFILVVVARIQIGKSFAISAQANDLVTHGLYSRIRHPIYVFAQLLLLGIVMCIESVPLFIAWLVLLSLQIRRARKEEEVLEKKYGSLYAEYKKRTWF